MINKKPWLVGKLPKFLAYSLEINKAGEVKLVNNIVDNYESYLSLDGIEFLTLKT